MAKERTNDIRVREKRKEENLAMKQAKAISIRSEIDDFKSR